MNVPALVLAVALAVNMCLTVALLTRRSHRSRPPTAGGPADNSLGLPPGPRIDAHPDLTDPYDAALTAWHTSLTGAPTADLSSHPTTGKVHHRRGRRNHTPDQPADPHRRDHQPDLLRLPQAGGPLPARPAGTVDTAALRPQPPTADDFAAAAKRGNPHWFIRLAETTDDPALEAAAWAGAAAVAWRIGTPDCADLVARAASVATLIDYDGAISGMVEHLRITTWLPGGIPLTVADRQSWLPAAAAMAAAASGDHRTALDWLRTAPLDDPAVEVLRIVEQARHGQPVILPSPHLTDATNRIAADAVSALT